MKNMNVWCSKKCPYGLVAASRKWYKKVKSVLLSLNLKTSKGDPSIFYYYKNDKLSGIVEIQVNDFLWSGDISLSKDIIPAFCKMFVIGKTSKNALHYLGLELNQKIHIITLDQIHYIDLLQSLHQKLANKRYYIYCSVSCGKITLGLWSNKTRHIFWSMPVGN